MWQIICGYLSAHTKVELRCSGSLYHTRVSRKADDIDRDFEPGHSLPFPGKKGILFGRNDARKGK